MNRKFWHVGFVVLFVSLLSGGIVVGARGAAPPDVSIPPAQRSIVPAIAPPPTYTYASVLTATTTSDPDTSPSYTCIGDYNLLKDNVASSARIVSLDIPGNYNTVIGNYIGTRADGTLPDVSPADRCDSTANTWYTGIGMDITGNRNRIGGPTEAERNVVAGMHTSVSSSTPPEAMNIDGWHNVVQNNYIGKDATGQDMWICGQAMDLSGHFSQILDNQIASTVENGWYTFGIWGSGISLDALTLRGNTFENFGDALEYGATVPESLRFFSPAPTTTLPISYAWQATGQVSVTNRGGWDNDVSFTWDTAGTKMVTVTVINAYGDQVDTWTLYVGQQTVETFEPGSDGRIDVTNPQGLTTTIQIPGNALSETTTFTYTEVGEPAHDVGDLFFAGRAFSLDASAALSGAITITLSYDDAGLTPEQESNLHLYHWAGAWENVADTCAPLSEALDEVYNTLRVAVCDLSDFGLCSDETVFNIYLPLVLRNFD